MADKIKYKRILYLISFCLTGILFPLSGQEVPAVADGSVSYISGQNIYVKFSNTRGIENGDTLYIRKNDRVIPALVVQNHSSVSCLCQPIGNLSFKVSDQISAKIKTPQPTPEYEPPPAPVKEKDVAADVIASVAQTSIKDKSPTSKTIRGKLTASSYSNFSDNSSDVHRFRYTFVANAGKTDS